MQAPADWPEDAREAAQLVIDKYGPPDEEAPSVLIWNAPGQWKRMVAYRDVDEHNFPVPHKDSVESYLQHSVPPEHASDLTQFDGSVAVNRTRGELSARCHDEEANRLALNLANDIVEGEKSVEEARSYYAKEFLGYREKQSTPYMESLRFKPNGRRDPDERVLSEAQLQAAIEAGRRS